MQLMSESELDPIISNEDDIEDDLVSRDLELKEINNECYLLGKNQETIETACTAIEELSDISSVMSVNNGVEADAASMAAICTESICRRLGYVSPRPMIPSLESFSYTNSKKQATEYALESFSEMAKDIWEKLVTFVKNLVFKIMDILRYIGHYISKILRNVGILRKQVETVEKDKTPVSTEVDFSRFCKVFNVENAKDLQGKVITVLENSLNTSKALHTVHDAITTFYKVALAANDVLTLIKETTDSNLDYKLFKLEVIEDNTDSVIVGDFIKAKHLKFYKKKYAIEIVDGEVVEAVNPMLTIDKDLNLGSMLDQAEKLADSIDDNVQRSEKNREGFKDLTETMVKAATKISNRSKTTQENKDAAKVFKNMAQTTVTVTSSLLQLVTENLSESLKYISFCKENLVQK